jgi:hypothetical protein
MAYLNSFCVCATADADDEMASDIDMFSGLEIELECWDICSSWKDASSSSSCV